MSKIYKIVTCSSEQNSKPSGNSPVPNVNTYAEEAIVDKSNPRRWDEEMTARWMQQEIKLPQFARIFMNENITGEELIYLTTDTLKELGVTSLGHRNRILRGISDLGLRPQNNHHDMDDSRDWNDRNSRNDRKSKKSKRRRTHTRDRDTLADQKSYHHLWELFGVNIHASVNERQFFDLLMSRSGLSQTEQHKIWDLVLSEQQHDCSFDDFAMMMKLTTCAQAGIPPEIINLDVIHTYHPPPAHFSQTSGGSAYTTQSEASLAVAQVEHMVEFIGIPQSVLDSDEMLYELESRALRDYNPIHFEIDNEILVATFSSNVSPQLLANIRQQTFGALSAMGLSRSAFQHLQLKIPTRDTPGGFTPGGPPHVAPHAGSHGAHIPPHVASHPPPRGPPPVISTTPDYVPGPPQTNMRDPLPPPPPYEQIPKQKMSNQPVSYDAIGRIEQRMNFMEEFNAKVDVESQFKNIRDGKIRTINAMQMLSQLRGVPATQVKFHDPGIKELTNLTRNDLDQLLSNCPKRTIAVLKGIAPDSIATSNTASAHDSFTTNEDERSFEEQPYVGMVIAGIPDRITDDDESLLALDSEVLSNVAVQHIEVVGSALRITFGQTLNKKELDDLRKQLKKFLFNSGLRKQDIKHVTIAPHTRQTWKGPTTDESEAVENNARTLRMQSQSTIFSNPEYSPMALKQDPHAYNRYG